MTFGIRVREVRELRGLTQAQLAERLALHGVVVDRSAIAHIEAGRIRAKNELREAIALATGFPDSFFEDEEDIDFPEGTLLFRARSDLTSRQEAEAREWGKLIFKRVTWLSGRVRVPPVTLPRLTGLTPEEAATHARAALGLSPDRPIPHLLNAIERAGVLVIAIPVHLTKRDAYSVWAGDPLRPVVVLMDGAPGDRLRFSAAHELGHLVMHAARPQRVRSIEVEAGRFAEELLMPARGIEQDLQPPITLTKLVPLKPRWGVSIQTLVRRARSLGVINANQYHYLFQQIGRQGWRLKEPENLDIPVEKARAVRKIIEVLYGEPPDYRRLAQDMRLHPHQAREVVERYAGKRDLPHPGAIGTPRLIPFPRPSIVRD